MAKANDPLQTVKDFLKSIEEDGYLLEPDPFQEQKEESIFKEQLKNSDYGKKVRNTSLGYVAPWDMNLRFAMSEENEEEYKERADLFSSMGIKRLEDELDSKFFELQKECLDWWDEQPFDLKRRCLERVLVLYGVQLVKSATKDKYKSILAMTAGENHFALKEACRHLRRFIDGAEEASTGAQLVIMQYELEKTKKELERKKALLKKKNKEIRKLKERETALGSELLDKLINEE